MIIFSCIMHLKIMEKKLLKTILDNKLISVGDRVGVGLSGGSDSMALVSCLLNLRERLGFSIVAIHVNHNLRGEESKRDEQFVVNFCAKNDIKCVVKNIDVMKNVAETKHTVEQSARNLRYNAFSDAIKECNLTTIALAHHKNDQAETILMHIGRGCGLNGLVGMKYQSGNYIRPMLDVKKVEVLEYLSKNDIAFVEDSSNMSDDYKRNYVRHNLVRTLEKTYAGAVDNLINLGRLASIDDDYINSQLPLNLITKRSDGVVLLAESTKYHYAIFSRLVMKCFEGTNSKVDVENTHIDAILNLFSNNVGKRLDMPNGMVAVKIYEGVLFKNKEEENSDVVVFGLSEFKFLNKRYIVELEATQNIDLKRSDVLYFDLDKISEGSVWRQYTSDDIFTKFGGGSKKVKDYLVSKKIDSEARKNIPVLANGNEVLIIAGVEISEMVKIDESTANVAKVYIKTDNAKIL